jgi:hypothetical protein
MRTKYKAWDGEKWHTEGVFVSHDGAVWHRPKGQREMRRVSWKVVWWTGLHEKNGVEIYEGDIVKRYEEVNESYGFRICEAQYSLPRACFQLVQADHECFGWPTKTEEKLEVIGNIHEHPHLFNNQKV